MLNETPEDVGSEVEGSQPEVNEATPTEAPSTETTPAETTPAESPAVAEVASTEAETSETSSGLADDLTLGHGAPAEDGEPEVEHVPVFRGKIDRFGVAMGTGRRKTSVARVRIKDGNGQLSINGRELSEYFHTDRDQSAI